MSEFPPKRFYLLQRVGEWPIKSAASENTAIEIYKQLCSERPDRKVRVVRMDIDTGFQWAPTELFFKAIHQESFVEAPEGSIEVR
jgi:hypothetical protein